MVSSHCELLDPAIVDWTREGGQRRVSNGSRKEGAFLGSNTGMIKKTLGCVDIKIIMDLLSWIELIMVFTNLGPDFPKAHDKLWQNPILLPQMVKLDHDRSFSKPGTCSHRT